MAIVICFLVLALHRAWLELQQSPGEWDWNRVGWGWLVAGVLASMAALIPLAIAWLQILWDFGMPVPWRFGAFVYCLGQLGKYVPGKAMVILLRAGHLHRQGFPVRPSVLSIFMETVTNFATGALLGAVLIQSMQPPRWLFWSAMVCIPFAILGLMPHPFRSIIARISRSRLGTMPAEISQAVDGHLMARTCSWCLVSWLFQGTALWFFLLGLDSNPDLVSWRSWLVCITSASLGGLAGFIAMVPGGAGVRELAVMWIMTSIVPAPIAILSAIVSRLGSMLAEVLLLALSWSVCGSRTNHNESLNGSDV